MNIRQIAEKAGVSVATVSRVQNHPETVAEETRKKVESVINECGYRPNYFARGMNLDKGNTIGLIVPDILNPSYMEIVKGIEEVVSKYGYITLMCDGDCDENKEKEAINNLLFRKIDGLILLSSSVDKKTLLSIKEIPVVSIGESNGEKLINTVKIDYKKASEGAVKHLINLGYKEIAIINGPKKKRENRMRFYGYEEALKSQNIKVNNDYIIYTNISMDDGYMQTKKLLSTENPPKAIFATDDILAMGVMAAVRDMNKKIPDDVAIVGFDNIKITRMAQSKLTTIENPLHEQGLIGAELLLNLINKEVEIVEPEQIILETKLIVRQSCGNNACK